MVKKDAIKLINLQTTSKMHKWLLSLFVDPYAKHYFVCNQAGHAAQHKILLYLCHGWRICPQEMTGVDCLR